MSTRPLFFALLVAASARAHAQTTAPTSKQRVPASPATASPLAPVSPNGSAPDFDLGVEPPIALDELIALALKNNQQPQIAQANLRAAQERAGSARARLGPTLQVVPGVFGNVNSRNEEIILSQPLDLFGQRRANRAVSEAGVRRAEAEQVLATRSLVVSVRNAAADLFAAQEAESLGAVQVAIARQFRNAAARKAQVGDAPPVQTQRAQLELDRAEIELDDARAQRLSRRATLNQFIGRAPELPLRVALPESGVFGKFLPASGAGAAGASGATSGASGGASGAGGATSGASGGASSAGGATAGAGAGTSGANSGAPLIGAGIGGSSAGASGSAASGGGVPSVSSDANPPSSPPLPGFSPEPPTFIVGSSSQVGSSLVASRAALLPGALQRPDVLSAQASLDAARAQVAVIAATRRPLVEIQARRGGVFDSSPTSLRAVITIPVFDFGAIKRQQRAAQFDAQGQELQVALLKSQVVAQVEGALIRLNQNQLRVARYRDSLVPQSLDLLRKTQIGYAAGASTFLEVLEAQRAARQIQTEYLQALVGIRTGQSALESAFGASVPAGVSSGGINNPGSISAPPGVATPGTLPPSATTPGMAPGTTPGSAPGTVSPNSTAPGTLVPGSARPGTVAPTSPATVPATPGTVAPVPIAPSPSPSGASPTNPPANPTVPTPAQGTATPR